MARNESWTTPFNLVEDFQPTSYLQCWKPAKHAHKSFFFNSTDIFSFYREAHVVQSDSGAADIFSRFYKNLEARRDVRTIVYWGLWSVLIILKTLREEETATGR